MPQFDPRRLLNLVIVWLFLLAIVTDAAFLFRQTPANSACLHSGSSASVSFTSSIGTSETRRWFQHSSILSSSATGVSLLEQEMDNSDRSVIRLADQTQRLWSYFRNIQRARRQRRNTKDDPPGDSNKHSKDKNNNQQRHHHNHHPYPHSKSHGGNDVIALTKPVRSLVAFFQQHPLSSLSEEQLSSMTKVERDEFIDAWKGAIIEALRAAGEANDHVLVLRLVDACCWYASSSSAGSNSNNNHHLLRLPPRWLGEAMEALSRTQANVSKVKQLWKLALQQHEEGRLSEPLSPFELNVACKALARRNKPRAALELYQTSGIPGDAYTASTLFTVLSESIHDDQEPLQEMTESTIASSKTKTSPCWQWNEAEVLLHDLSIVLNNHAICTALQLNERATTLFGTPRQQQGFGGQLQPLPQQQQHVHDGATIALNLLQRMMEEWKLTPDVVTCSWIMSALEKGFRYQEACTLLQDMIKGGRRGTDKTTSSWLPLPPPNVYTYSLAISSCAQCHQHALALEMLEAMRSHGPAPNTWVYNAAIAAVAASGRQRIEHDDEPTSAALPQQRNQPMALYLLRQMQLDAQHKGLDTRPDTVTYNTVLAAFDDSNKSKGNNRLMSDRHDVKKHQENHQAVLDLLEEMKQSNVARDCITYRHTILACQSNAELVLDLLDRAMVDCKSGAPRAPTKVWPESKSSSPFIARSSSSTSSSQRGLEFVLHGAMSVLAVRGDWNGAYWVLQKMKDANVYPNKETWSHLLTALGRGGQAPLVPIMLQAIQGDLVATQTLLDTTCLNVHYRVTVETDIYSAAISACLDAKDLNHALQVLSMMKAQGLTPTPSSLEAITYAYARLAMEAAAEEAKEQRQRESQADTDRDDGGDQPFSDVDRVSVARAHSAFRLVQTLENAPAKLLSAVTRACAAAQLWQEAKLVLRILHGRALREQGPIKHDVVKVLPTLHRSLLKLCASQGNVTAALWYVEDIQGITRRLSPDDEGTEFSADSVDVLFHLDDQDESPKTVRIAGRNIGMKAEDWKLLIIAASKSGHWKVCINSLQLLQPFVEQTRPSFLPQSADEESDKDKNYERLSRALIGTILCLEMKNQYGWVVRVIDDWIRWSGRRPPFEAVLSAFRILAARSGGEEVAKMLARVLQVPPEAQLHRESNEGVSYEEILYIGAITSLHINGLYDDADGVYLVAISQGHLDYAVASDDALLTLDLHGMNVAIAHAAVRITFQQEVLTSSWNQTGFNADTAGQGKRPAWYKDMLIVTGRGRNSAQRMRPVLRPEIQRMLLEEFYPPLSTISVPGNMGAIRVPAEDIDAWLSHQREQRDVQLLAAANVLKELSSGNRLRRSIFLRLRQSSKPTMAAPFNAGQVNVTNNTAAIE